MILVRNLRLEPGETEDKLRERMAKALRVPPASLGELTIVRKSLDARKKTDVHWLYAAAASVPHEKDLLSRAGKHGKQQEPYVPYHYEIPRGTSGEGTRPVVAGFGPAGMFAALLLAEAGLRPLILERGDSLEIRREKVRTFWEKGILDETGNVQFGEGGAGAFSDGKLATNTHDRRNQWVLEQFRRFGAPASVTYDAKPHVGTDVLATVVRNLRQRIEELGGEIRFGTRFTGYETDPGGALRMVLAETAEGRLSIPCRALILAPGHSARDTFEELRRAGVAMEPKPFSMGVRIEHLQREVSAAQYGQSWKKLPPADYQGSVHLPSGDSVYTFCMCPGGYVVAAASENGGVVTNGMSYSGRAGENANAALLVTVRPEDFPREGGVLAGMYWQREIERRCWAYGGGNWLAPAQTVGDFLSGRKSAGPGRVEPTCRPGVVWGDLREALPAKITDTLALALPVFAERLRFFAEPDAVLTAPETRSSSPIRILRGDTLQSSVPGIYPCGEGAGYAGGITSAAVDGMRCAEAVILRRAPGK